MVRKQLTAPIGLGCLAAAVMIGTANIGLAFQEERQQQQTERQQTPDQDASSHAGEFDAFGRGYIRMTIQGNNSHRHNVNEQTQITIDGRPARLNDLRTGDRIRVTTGPNNVALEIEALRQGEQNQAFAQETQDTRRRPDFQENGESRVRNQNTAWLGVVLNEPEQGQEGVQITRIYPSGPAARAGLYSGDRLVQVAGKQVASVEEAAKIIEEAKPSEAIELVVMRGEQRQTITATLANRSDFFMDERFDDRRDQGNQGDDDFSRFEGSEIPDHAMMLEQHRRFAEQHQRIEEKLNQVLTELEDLRKQLGQAPRGQRPGAGRPDLDTPVDRIPDAQEPIEEPPTIDEAVEDSIEDAPEIERPEIERPEIER
jgi:hypothetical protein